MKLRYIKHCCFSFYYKHRTHCTYNRFHTPSKQPAEIKKKTSMKKYLEASLQTAHLVCTKINRSVTKVFLAREPRGLRE